MHIVLAQSSFRRLYKIFIQIPDTYIDSLACACIPMIEVRSWLPFYNALTFICLPMLRQHADSASIGYDQKSKHCAVLQRYCTLSAEHAHTATAHTALMFAPVNHLACSLGGSAHHFPCCTVIHVLKFRHQSARAASIASIRS